MRIPFSSMLAVVDKAIYNPWFVRVAAIVTIIGVVGILHSALSVFRHTPGVTALGFLIALIGLAMLVGSIAIRRRLLHAAELTRGEVETNRHMMTHAANEEKYWPVALLTDVPVTSQGAPLLDKPRIYRPVQDAYIRFRTWNDRSSTHLGEAIPPDQLPRLRADVSSVQHADDMLDELIRELTALPRLFGHRG